MQDILTFMDVLPDYIILFCPGYITIYIYIYFKINFKFFMFNKKNCFNFILKYLFENKTSIIFAM